jgi:hypothetical protein
MISKIKEKLLRLRRLAYKKKGYEESYIYLMNGIDRIIGELK